MIFLDRLKCQMLTDNVTFRQAEHTLLYINAEVELTLLDELLTGAYGPRLQGIAFTQGVRGLTRIWGFRLVFDDTRHQELTLVVCQSKDAARRIADEKNLAAGRPPAPRE